MGKLEGKEIIDGCELKVIDGHLEATCMTEEDRAELAKIFAEEAVLRVRPKVKENTGGTGISIIRRQ